MNSITICTMNKRKINVMNKRKSDDANYTGVEVPLASVLRSSSGGMSSL